MKYKIYKTLLAILICTVSKTAESAELSLTSGLEYSTGKYGETDTTDILYIPITGTYETGPWFFSLTVPYISATGTGTVSRDIGRYKTAGSSTSRRTTESGLGDVLSSASYNILKLNENSFRVDLTGNIKFGTADETKNLGTGENDYSIQIDVYKYIDKFTVFGTFGSKTLGSPSGISLDNVLYGALGSSYMFTEQMRGSVIFQTTQKAIETGSEQSMLTASANYKVSELWMTQVYIAKGLADGSPDSSIGAMLTRYF